MRRHAKHLLMCSPMILVTVILLASGAGVGVLVPLIACMAMMAFMMGGMGHDGAAGSKK